MCIRDSLRNQSSNTHPQDSEEAPAMFGISDEAQELTFENVDLPTIHSQEDKLKWRPTPEWYRKFKESLPLENILRVLEFTRAELKRKSIQLAEGKVTLTSDAIEEIITGIAGAANHVRLLKPKHELCIETLTEFTYINSLLHVFIWAHIVEKSTQSPKFENTRLELLQQVVKQVHLFRL
eukprot:TRINITY_DN25394_c0_g2_i2.p1 TRINITY_DN25394_c0_g2~~TRINITY_DN25394_c0_g2_i2.p1  ORF type:complete len:188 (+),score=38.83 TRINITY_DN25394_c0_g2_i2:25-564(+)